MSSKPRAWTWTVRTMVLMACILTFSRAGAQGELEPAGYRETIDEAVLEFGAHHFEEARSLFSRAHALYPNARTHRGLGQAEFELRNYVACLIQLEAALRSHERPLEGELRADTERLLARAGGFVGRYLLELRPQEARLTVDGVELALGSDKLVLLRAGDHVLEVHAAGYESERRQLSTRGGEQESLTIALRVQKHTSSRREERRLWYKNPWLWSAVGVVAAGVAIGTGFALRDRSEDVYGGSSRTVVTGPR